MRVIRSLLIHRDYSFETREGMPPVPVWEIPNERRRPLDGGESPPPERERDSERYVRVMAVEREPFNILMIFVHESIAEEVKQWW